jgi:hypothetical protein
MQGLKPSILMGKFKQHLPHEVSPDTDLFLSMFMIRLPPSMREAVGAGNHKTAVGMVRAADALWNARGSHDPTVAAPTTQCSRSPAPTGRKKNDRRNGNARSKSRPPFGSDFFSFYNPGNGMCKYHSTTTAMHFPANAGLIFPNNGLTNDRYLVDTGATLSTVPCTSNASPSGPLLQGADGQQGGWTSNPLLRFCFKNCPVSGQTFYCQLFASRSGRSNSRH